MLCHLPAPYPDELLYSVIARHLVRTDAINVRNAIDHLFGRKAKACVDLPSSLNAVSKRTWLIWGMTGEEIADRLTLFPYYARYVPHERVGRCLDALRSDNGIGVHTRLGLSTSRVRSSPFLRFCEACRARDLIKYSETYWHRSHQLAGVLVCPEHGGPLIDSSALLRPRAFSGFADATQCTADIARASDNDLNGSDAINAFKIANRCRDMLLGPVSTWPQENKPLAYRLAVLERGFAGAVISLRIDKFEKALAAFYGEPLLFKLGCGIQLGQYTNWVRKFFYARARKDSFHPLQHALVQVFLESTPIAASRKIPFGLGPWKCPNPYAVHEERFLIKRASIKIQPSGEFVASVKCGCGFRFTFSHTSDADPELPVVKNMRGFGPTWEAEAERLRQSGLCKSAIAKKMRIAFKTVDKLLKKPRRTRSCPAKIEEWRQEWSKILGQVPDRSCVLARRKNAALYAKLRRWDKEWLRRQSQPRNARFAAKSKVDWVKRDMEWSQILRAAAQEIKTSKLARRRITPSTIIMASGLSSIASRSYLDRLPTCRSVLNECSESSLDDSRERRLRAAVDEAREVRLPPKEWAFRLLSGLSGKELSPRLKAVLQEIVSNPGN